MTRPSRRVEPVGGAGFYEPENRLDTEAVFGDPVQLQERDGIAFTGIGV